MSATCSSNSAECTGDAVRNLEVYSFLSSKKTTRLFVWLSLTLEVEYIMLYTVNY